MFKLNLKMVAFALAGGLMVSCEKDNPNTPIPTPTNDGLTFHLGYGVGYTGTASAYLAPFIGDEFNKTDKNITFEGEGKVGKAFEAARTHRLYTSTDGRFVYDLEYGNGKIVKYQVSGDENLYTKVKELDVKNIMGTSNPRWKVIDDSKALLFEVTPKYSGRGGKITTKPESSLRILAVDLTNFSLVGTPQDIPLPEGKSSAELPEAHIWRVDNAIIHNGKVYIGTAVQGFDATTQKIINTRVYNVGTSLISHPATTLVLDYNGTTFSNPKLSFSADANGENYGYRAPSYLIDNNEVYNITMEGSTILKINPTTGEYVDGFKIDLGAKLGLAKIDGTGIFYAGNGIAYAPFCDAEKSGPADGTWGIARVDLRSGSVIKMNLPEKLWMRYYQAAKIGKDGKLYMAICPTTGTGNIYAFDPANATPNGFTKGATLNVSGEGFYMGVY